MTQFEINERISLEHALIKFLIETAREHGFLPLKVWEGEDYVGTPTDAEMMGAIFSVDGSTAYFKRVDEAKAHCAVIILGNSGWDAINDHSCGEGWDEVIKAVEERFEPKE